MHFQANIDEKNLNNDSNVNKFIENQVFHLKFIFRNKQLLLGWFNQPQKELQEVGMKNVFVD